MDANTKPATEITARPVTVEELGSLRRRLADGAVDVGDDGEPYVTHRGEWLGLAEAEALVAGPVRVTTRGVGQAFGCQGVIKRGKRVVWETPDVYPLGCEASALDEALRRAERIGHTISR